MFRRDSWNGRNVEDRAEMLEVLANLDPQPESVPLNALVPVKGTPLENQTPIQPLERWSEWLQQQEF